MLNLRAKYSEPAPSSLRVVFLAGTAKRPIHKPCSRLVAPRIVSPVEEQTLCELSRSWILQARGRFAEEGHRFDRPSRRLHYDRPLSPTNRPIPARPAASK